MSQTQKTITIARGDGIGPEIMDATLSILDRSGANLKYEEIEVGEKVYMRGHSSGIEDSAWESLRRTKIFLKAPITTPQGGGYKSLNVTIRKRLGLFANVRPCNAYAPYVPTRFPNLDVVIVRENEEDLYAGIEHRQTDEVYQCLKLITRPGTERIVRYAFEYARLNNRKKVTCMTKDNIMKMTDGLFHKIFDEISADYPEFEKEHYIVDIGSARLADDPERFDLVVLPNLYGDILSDVVAEIAGSVGMAGSANIGEHISMFEAIHGSAPRMAGQNRANPSGLFLGAVQMLVHMGLSEAAERCHNAWLKTLEDGIHTGDIASDTYTKKKVGTKEFAAAIVERLGDTPKILKPVSYKRVAEVKAPALKSYPPAKKNLLGFDVFVHERDRKAQNLAARIEKVSKDSAIHLKMITNRGVTVWPEGFEETFCTDHWRCRMVGNAAGPIDPSNIWKTLKALQEAGVEVIKTENLYEFDGERGYSLGQGE